MTVRPHPIRTARTANWWYAAGLATVVIATVAAATMAGAGQPDPPPGSGFIPARGAVEYETVPLVVLPDPAVEPESALYELCLVETLEVAGARRRRPALPGFAAGLTRIGPTLTVRRERETRTLPAPGTARPRGDSPLLSVIE